MTNALARRDVKHVDSTGNSMTAERLIIAQDYNLAFLTLELSDKSVGGMYGIKIAEQIRKSNKQTGIYGFCHSTACDTECNSVWIKNGFNFFEANGHLDEKILKNYR